jgi:hypothetical protein
MPFVVSCGPVCSAPVITLAPPSPAVLCQDDDRSVSVTFSGSVASSCQLTSTGYVLTDNMGSGSQGPVTVGSNGTFAVTVMLSANRSGRQYSFSVQAGNSGGNTTSSPVTLGVQEDCHDRDDDDRDGWHHNHHRHHDSGRD